MKQVKIISEKYEGALERSVNNFLESPDISELIDIKFEIYDTWIYAFIIYGKYPPYKGS